MLLIWVLCVRTFRCANEVVCCIFSLVWYRHDLVIFYTILASSEVLFKIATTFYCDIFEHMGIFIGNA